MKIHLAETYASFIGEGCVLKLNGVVVQPIAFDVWAFPPDYLPRHASMDIEADGEAVHIDLTVGLIRDRDPEAENYGVYFYCNNRLVVKEWRTREVGYFVTGEAGVAHPDASLCRAVVRLQGAAKLMPWNSSKSGINVGHPVFEQLVPTLIPLVSYFSSLSRRLKHDWEGQVFRYDRGSAEDVDRAEAARGVRLNLPTLPRVNKSQVEHINRHTCGRTLAASAV